MRCCGFEKRNIYPILESPREILGVIPNAIKALEFNEDDYFEIQKQSRGLEFASSWDLDIFKEA